MQIFLVFLGVRFFEVNALFFDDEDKAKFCSEVEFCTDNGKEACGLRAEGEGFRLKVFVNECQMMEDSCQVDEPEAYGKINLEYCQKAFPDHFNRSLWIQEQEPSRMIVIKPEPCSEFLCETESDTKEICGIRQEGEGFKIRLFPNKCELFKHNCLTKLAFQAIERYVCNSLSSKMEGRTDEENKCPCNKESEAKDDDSQDERNEVNVTDNAEMRKNVEATTGGDIYNTCPCRINNDLDVLRAKPDVEFNSNELPTEKNVDEAEDVEITTANFISPLTPTTLVEKNIVILDGSMIGYTGDIQETMDNFFAGTHIFDLPVKNVKEGDELSEDTRRRLINNFGHVKVFKPWLLKPANISTDYMHLPTLNSCYHKCPLQCPETYAPVCGVPGATAREPSLMFKNHCFMDVAQCKMRWEDKSSTSIASAYIESSFLICLGDSLMSVYRFLPLVRTLQHMGRLADKAPDYKHRIRNMGNFNDMLLRHVKLMG